MALDSHADSTPTGSPGWGPGAAAAAPANEAVTLRAFLLGVQEAIKGVPAAWVRCELHKVSAKARLTELELVETDAAGAVAAKVRAVVWQARWRRIADAFAAAGLSLEAGSRVLIHVRARLQPGFGFDLEANDIDLNFSLGDHAARVRAIREELKAKGFYGRQHALPPVRDFLRVCVIAPAGAAGRADFVRVAGPLHEHRLVEILHLDAVFQSAAASASIREALRAVYKDCAGGRFCAVALVRGGGASADLAHLACFELARAVCLMPVPVLVGIGHEVDRGLLDEVAHLSLPTPTAVAHHIRGAVVSNARAAHAAIEAVRAGAQTALARAETGVAKARADARERGRAGVERAAEAVRAGRRALEPDARRLLDAAARRVAAERDEARRAAEAAREDAAGRVRGLRAGIAAAVRQHLRPAEDGLAVARSTVAAAPALQFGAAEAGVAGLRRAVLDGAEATVLIAGQGVSAARDAAAALDPRRLLASGYAILRDTDGRPLTTTEALRAEPEVRAELADGTTTLRPVLAGG
ncbi:MAG TPA: exodeoxyribonuclease VII large subunit [Acetobacteraceae bacterium]|nr:exodeoxyribonuclease VII large subunit [Acetobacteraceae bacterium]